MTLKSGIVEDEKLPTDNETLMKLFLEQKEEIKKLREDRQKGGNTDMATIIREVARAMKDGQEDGYSFNKGITSDTVDDGDFDEKGVLFCAPTSGYVITDYILRGKRIVPPYDIQSIFFEHKQTRRKREGKEHQIFYTSFYHSRSKKVTEFLRNHPLYDIYFFESQKAMNDQDAKKAIRTAQIFNMVKDYAPDKILKMCSDYKLPKNESLDVMKSQVVLHILAQEEASEKAISLKIANETHKALLLAKEV